MLIFFFLVYCYKKTVKSFRLKIFHWEKKTRKKPSRPEHLFSSFFCSSVRLKQVKSTQQLHQFRRKKNPKPESCHSQLLYIATARSLTAGIGSSRALTHCQRKQEPGKCPGWTWASHSYFWSKAFGTLRILLDKLWNLWSLHTRLKDYLECLHYVSEGRGWVVASKHFQIFNDTCWQASSHLLFSSAYSEYLQLLLLLKEPEHTAGKPTWSPTLSGEHLYQTLSCLSYSQQTHMETGKISTWFENCEITTLHFNLLYS